MTAAVLALAVRVRVAAGAERQQLRWVGSGAALAFVGVLVFPIAEWLGWPDELVRFVCRTGFACLPLTFTVAILRYRLYDLDRLISRTVTYAAVSGLLGLAYVVLVTAASRLTPSGGSLAVAASTLAVAALFQPLRRRVQNAVDRQFNRARYDAEQTVVAFALRLREHVDHDVVWADLLAVSRETLQPASAGLWLRPSGTSWPRSGEHVQQAGQGGQGSHRN